MHKKAQTEDIFNDLIPALILIVITVIIISINGSGEAKNAEKAFASDMSSLKNLDIITYLRMPVAVHDSLSEYIIALNSGSQDALRFTKGIDPYECDAGLASELRSNIGKAYNQWSLRVFDSKSDAMIFSCYSDDDFFIDGYRLYTVDTMEILTDTTLSNDIEMAYFLPLGMRYNDISIPTNDPAKNLIVRLGVKDE